MRIRKISVDEFMKRNRERFGVSDPRYKAQIKKLPAFFEGKLAFRFDDLCDDLEEFKAASFSADDGLVFTLQRYKNQPDQNTTVEADVNYTKAEVASILKAIQEVFQLMPDDIVLAD
jgi:hypothetical protein